MERRFLDQTDEVILQRMLDRIADDIDKREGSIAADLLSPASLEIADVYMQLDNVLQFGFADTTYGEFLDLRVAEVGLERKPSVRATGVAKFEAQLPIETVIPVGTRMYTGDLDEGTAIFFETTSTETMSGTMALVEVEAVVEGEGGNISAGKVLTLETEINGIKAVSSYQDFKDGADTESDEQLLERYHQRLQNPTTSGNANHYRDWAREIDGVKDARIYPLHNGPGTVKVVLLSESLRSPSPKILTEATEYIETQRPLGANVTVTGVEEIPININATLILEDGADLAVVKEAIRKNITAYLDDIAFEDLVIRYSRVSKAIMSVEDVVDYDGLLINGVAANVAIQDDQVAITGNLTFS